MNQIKPKEGTTNLLFNVSCSDENWEPVEIAYKEFSKKELQEYLSLKETLEKLRETHSNIVHIALYDSLHWLESVPYELEEIKEYLENNERCYIDTLPEELLQAHLCRTEGTECLVNKYGIRWKTYVKHTNVEAYIWEIPWSVVEQLLKNCDPQSVRFIKE